MTVAGNLLRQVLWSFIAFAAGYYAANVVSLSFGALAINDVVAAILTVAFCEVGRRCSWLPSYVFVQLKRDTTRCSFDVPYLVPASRFPV